MVEAAIRGPVARGALAPGAASVLIAGASDEAVHRRRTGLLYADAAATAGRDIVVTNVGVGYVKRN